MPYSGPASSYATIGKSEAAYFKMINERAASTAARSISSAMTTATRRRRRWNRRASWSRMTKCCSSSIRSARHEYRDPEIHEHQEGAAAVRRDGRREMGRSEALPVDHGLAAQLPGRGAHLRAIHHEQKKYDTGASDTEIKIGNIIPYSGPRIGLRHHREDGRSLLQDDQRSGRHQRPQDQLRQL
jgi:hypothetical protein